MRLTRSEIVTTGLHLLAAYGLGDVTMRRIANCLGVAPGALYWHVENKQALITELAREVLRPVFELATTPSPPGPAELMAEFRRAVLPIRDAADVVSAGIANSGLHGEVLGLFEAAVAREGLAGEAAKTLLHFAIGAVVTEQGARQLAEAGGKAPRLGSASAASAAFEAGTRLILAGAAAA